MVVQQYQDWIKNNFPEGTFPTTKKSLGCEQFRSRETSWLHIDQIAGPQGLHVYQGAVYLEHAAEDDWTFEVLEGSHKFFDEFWDEHPEERETSMTKGEGSSKFTPEMIEWWNKRGCQSRYVAVPKGGLVLWDSRTVHANANPVKGRANPDRWRWVLIVSMWPASLVNQQGIEARQQAYNTMTQTCHDLRAKVSESLELPPARPLTELPEVARSLDARRLAGYG
nr:hypothetical protein BaRGS_002164 [Batillaria attramentaria]